MRQQKQVACLNSPRATHAKRTIMPSIGLESSSSGHSDRGINPKE